MNDFEKKIQELEAKINVLSNDKKIATQRTEDWFKARRGKFTGSKIKDLMKCSRATARIEWGVDDKIFDLGDAAIKYIFTKAQERKHGYYCKTYGSRAMSYGTENESVIKDLYTAKNPNDFVEDCEFIAVNDYLGASPDGKITDELKIQKALEIKASTTFEQYFNRVEVPFDEKHMDFWQVQTEMLALEVEECHYVVALPPHDILEPVIQGFELIVVKASRTHQNAILQRAKLGNLIIEKYLAGMPFYAAVRFAVKNFII